jgi:cytochrome c-type biogenesis protein CcmE
MAVNDPSVDLSPRPVAPATGRRRKRKWPAATLLAVALIGVGIVLFEGLSNATSYYCNADEVGVKVGCSGTKRFRLQGTVLSGSVHQSTNTVDFTVEFNNAKIPVHHLGDPQDLFKEGIGVVLEGVLVPGGVSGASVPATTPSAASALPAGTYFESDLMMVKHSEQYKKANPSRVPNGAP